MLQRTLPAGFIAPCLPIRSAKLPSGGQWLHEIKHDGFRMLVRRDAAGVRLFTRNGHDWTGRFPLIARAALSLKAASRGRRNSVRPGQRARPGAAYGIDELRTDGPSIRPGGPYPA